MFIYIKSIRDKSNNVILYIKFVSEADHKYVGKNAIILMFHSLYNHYFL